MDYYGLNRQGAATSGIYTRNPTPVTGVRSPYAAQSLYAEPEQAEEIGPDLSPRIEGMGTGTGFSAPGPDSPATAEARASFAGYGGYESPANPLSGMAKKTGVSAGMALGYGLDPATALNYGVTAGVTPAAMTTAALKSVNTGVPYESSVRSLGRDFAAIDDQNLSELGDYRAKQEAWAKTYDSAQSLATQAKKAVYGLVAPQAVVKSTAPFDATPHETQSVAPEYDATPHETQSVAPAPWNANIARSNDSSAMDPNQSFSSRVNNPMGGRKPDRLGGGYWDDPAPAATPFDATEHETQSVAPAVTGPETGKATVDTNTDKSTGVKGQDYGGYNGNGEAGGTGGGYGSGVDGEGQSAGYK